MDKEKIKEILEDTLLMTETIEGFDKGDTERLLDVRHKINEALEELSAPDWISVEDELPDMYQTVWVCDGDDHDEVWTTHRTDPDVLPIDINHFASPVPGKTITHWRTIDKLED